MSDLRLILHHASRVLVFPDDISSELSLPASFFKQPRCWYFNTSQIAHLFTLVLSSLFSTSLIVSVVHLHVSVLTLRQRRAAVFNFSLFSPECSYSGLGSSETVFTLERLGKASSI